MPKQFFHFDAHPFREQLLEHFIVPAANWFIGKENEGYLLPQASGSHWECALAIESLFTLIKSQVEIPNFDRDLAREKCVQTIRWLISRANVIDAKRCNWDGVTWDTAICCRLLLKAELELKETWSVADKKNFSRIRENSVRWLVESTYQWHKDIRYPAGPPDLAQVLHTFSLLSVSHPQLLTRVERELGLPKNTKIIDRISRLLLAMEQREEIELRGEKVETRFWVDCFNTSEVVEGLTAYLIARSTRSRPDQIKLIAEVRQSIFGAIRYIECSQSDATWGGVADTCGTLYGYLRVTSQTNDLEPNDHIVFQALRWMCDEKQALSDGSFLHTTYVTVFYFMALIQTYETWKLGAKTAPEVYDIALWSAPSQEGAERSRRLELQISLEDTNLAMGKMRNRLHLMQKLLVSELLIFVQLTILLFICTLTNVLRVDLSQMNIDIIDSSQFWSLFGLGVTIIAVSTPAIVSLFLKNHHI